MTDKPDPGGDSIAISGLIRMLGPRGKCDRMRIKLDQHRPLHLETLTDHEALVRADRPHAGTGHLVARHRPTA
ncbi:MAG TPA: hypothetical protein VN043_08270 [Rhodanobacter sp.]|nr:hypothetical protein [Rhodanobacter sp.]